MSTDPLDWPTPASWRVTTDWRCHGRRVAPGTEVSVRGLRGRYRFLRHVEAPAGEWVDLIGPAREEAWRSVRPERVSRVHLATKGGRR